MKYILLMNLPKSGFEVFGAWSPADIQANIAFVTNLNKELRATGEFVGAEGLSLPNEAKVVRARKDGGLITDGVFPESKEFCAGYLMVEVASPERAYEIAGKWSASPGPGGAPLYMPIEVRRVGLAPK